MKRRVVPVIALAVTGWLAAVLARPASLVLTPTPESEPNNTPDTDGLEDIDHFARFMRATKAPARDATLSATPQAQRGSVVFDKIGCAVC